VNVPRKTLRQLYAESDLFAPRAADERKLFDFHRDSRLNNVDDSTRSTKFTAGYTSSDKSLDRAGNVDVPYRASNQIYDRKLHRYGRAAGDDDSVAAYDLGRNSGLNRQGAPGVRQTVVPTATYAMKESEEETDEMSTEDVLESQVQWAANYIAGIEDEEEREMTAVAFSEMFANSFGDTFDMFGFYESAISTRH